MVTLLRKYITHVERALGSQRTILKNDRKKMKISVTKRQLAILNNFNV